MFSLSTIALLLSPVLAGYSLVDDYTNGNFANQFDFFTGNDPTNGYVNYVDYATAQSSGLYSASNGQVYIGVDHNNTATGRGRNSVRISSKKSYQHGLIILDLEHMPGGACGTWPAFWLLSTTATWPNGGEIDIIEGVNTQNYNTMAAHTNAGCSISNTGGMSGQIVTPNCDVNAAGQAANQGCSIKTSNTNSYGTGFNSIGGGVYATEWTSNGILIWFFPRGSIPSDISSGSPNPSGWGLPMSKFAGACDWDEKVVNQQIIFDVTFCGDWAGNTFSSDSTCSSKASTCQAFVQNNPSAFSDTYWSINGLKVFQNNGQSATSTTSSTTSTSFYPSSSTQYTTSFVTSTRTVIASTTSSSSTTSLSLTTYSFSSSSTTTTSSTTTFSSTYATSTSATQSIPTTSTTTIATTSSIIYQTTTSTGWNNWPNTFYTVTRSAGWSGQNGPGNWGGSGGGRPGNWGGPPRV